MILTATSPNAGISHFTHSCIIMRAVVQDVVDVATPLSQADKKQQHNEASNKPFSLDKTQLKISLVIILHNYEFAKGLISLTLDVQFSKLEGGPKKRSPHFCQ